MDAESYDSVLSSIATIYYRIIFIIVVRESKLYLGTWKSVDWSCGICCIVENILIELYMWHWRVFAKISRAVYRMWDANHLSCLCCLCHGHPATGSLYHMITAIYIKCHVTIQKDYFSATCVEKIDQTESNKEGAA